MKDIKTEPWQTAEGRDYIEHFKTFNPFALFKVGGELISDSEKLGIIATDAATLWANGVKNVYVNGGGKYITHGLAKTGIQNTMVNGERVTSTEAMLHIPDILAGVTQTVCDAIDEAVGANITVPVTSGVFTATLSNPEDLGSADIVWANTDPVFDVLKEGLVPIVSCAGKLAIDGAGSEQAVNINADKSAVSLAAMLAVKKFVSYLDVQGVMDENGDVFPQLMPEEVEVLKKTGIIKGGMAVKTDQAVWLLDQGVDSVALVPPDNLQNELFQKVGAGTLIKLAQTPDILEEKL